MIIDKFLQVSKEQAVTTAAPSTDVIDFEQANPNSGASDRLYFVITISQTATASGAATVSFEIQDSENNSGFATVVATGAIGKADLTEGAQFVIAMPVKHRRYVRINYAVDTGPLTAGKFSAQLVTGYQQNPAYPSAW